MQRFLPVLIALVLLFLTAGCNLNQEADFQKGNEAFKKKDYETALREWRPLAEQGHAEAQYWLGVMYGRGQAVPQNHKIALKWWKLAAEEGHAWAMIHLGASYRFGKGVPKNLVYAYMWYDIAASQGHEIALGNREDVVKEMTRSIANRWSTNQAPGNRHGIAKEMTPSQIGKAQELAAECVKKKYKGCD